MATEPGSPYGRPTLPLTVPLALALAVWGAGLVRSERPPPGPPHIAVGSITELAPAIRAAPRAVVYVGCVWSFYSVPGRERFVAAAEDIAGTRRPPGVRFFVLVDESAADARAWAEAFGDERLEMFGHLGGGWVLWLEHGRLREVESHAGYPRHSHQEIVESTRAVWP